MKKLDKNLRPRVQRARPNVTGKQIATLTEAMPEKYRELVLLAIEQKRPLSASVQSTTERMMVIRAFKEACKTASLPPGLIFHDLTRANLLPELNT